MFNISEHIAQKWSHLKPHPVYVACSGGLDSTVLLSILHLNNFKVNAIHVNYHLRGEDSNLDEDFIQRFCEERSIPFESKSIELGKQLIEGGNLQQLAREIRYEWFNEIVSKNPNSSVFLAHHLDDQVETFFLNLARKSGVMGLACMPYERNNIVRPLLDFSKSDLKEFAIKNKIEWREDISNETNKYRRNFLRNEVLPYLTSQLPDLNESVLLLIKKFQDKQKSLELEVEPILNEILNNHQIDFKTIQNIDEFQLNELFRQLGQPINKALELISLIDSQKGKKIQLLPHPSNPFNEIVRDDNVFSFLLIESNKPLNNLNIEIVEVLPSTFNKNEIYLDANKINGSLKVRFWQEGDRIEPVGMKGSQLISDIISDAKLTAIEKQNVLIVHDDKTIHWCVGMKVGRKAVASNSSKKILKIKIT